MNVDIIVIIIILSGGGHGGDREVTINVKRGVEARNYGDVRILGFPHLTARLDEGGRDTV